jgi:hypothetical protein
MTLQEIIQSLDDLPMQDQTSLLNVLNSRLATIASTDSVQPSKITGETFWEMTLRFRERMERNGIEFTDEDFADLRDRTLRSIGRGSS